MKPSIMPILLFLTILLHLTTPIFSTSRPRPPSASLPKEALPTRSGYLPINKATGSAMYYSFYEAQEANKTSLSKTPLLIWLQGGPGCSSQLGNFFELGPWRVSTSPESKKTDQVELEKNPGPWNRIFGMVFLDNPIGTGFSIASSRNEIPTNQNDVAKHLWIGIQELLSVDPSFKSRPIYLTGESYAGKYIPAFGYYALKKNSGLPKSTQLNIQGVAIGNGLTDPSTQIETDAITAYYIGLINEKQKEEVQILELETVALAKSRKWRKATDVRTKVHNTLTNMTGLPTLYDVTRVTGYETPLVDKLLNNVEVKRALKAKESINFTRCSDVVLDVLKEDVMKSVKDKVEFLVKNTRVLLYQGANDLRDGVESTSSWVKNMKWEGIGKFLDAEREVWKVNGLLAGYVQKWDNLCNVVVLNAGHLAPHTQPINTQAMIEDWVQEKGLFANK
ncbi:serine protease [Lithospermum erythrorhizon]|uniref:Carboxypeptidase n=1 Tax=Lithospermum erythrorhizon TaxID=34254 RepID=A0AAV3Q9W1_LITER